MKKAIRLYCGDDVNSIPTCMYSPVKQVEHAIEILKYLDSITKYENVKASYDIRYVKEFEIMEFNHATNTLTAVVKSNSSDFFSAAYLGALSLGFKVEVYVNKFLSKTEDGRNDALTYFNEADDMIANISLLLKTK